MNRRSILTTSFAAAVVATVLGVSAAASASNTSQTDPYTADRAAIAQYARDNGLTGLSPASLHPIGD